MPDSDNVIIKDGANATVSVAADVVDGEAFQRVKITHGPADATPQDVSITHPMPVSPADAGDLASVLTDGRKTVATPGVGTPLVTIAQPARWVAINAIVSNVGTVYVGGATARATSGSETGTPLEPGDSVTLPVANVAAVFIDSLAVGDGVTFTAGL